MTKYFIDETSTTYLNTTKSYDWPFWKGIWYLLIKVFTPTF
jgi:hypothetical protein